MVITMFGTRREVFWMGLIPIIAVVSHSEVSGQTVYRCKKRGVDLVFQKLTDHQLCCDGEVEDKDPVKGKDCCDDVGKFYYKTEKLCCEGVILDNREGLLGCCGNITYNTSSHVCCRDTLHPRLDNMTGMRCCGNMRYNQSKDICCEDPDNHMNVQLSKRYPDMDCCGNHVIDKRYWDCSKKTGRPQVIGRQEEMCNTTKIDTTRQTCCADTVYNVPMLDPRDRTRRNPQSECCGTIGYNPKTHVCCPYFNLVLPKDGSLKCCGNGSVDLRNQVCCGNQAVNLTIPRGKCCGQKLIDPDTQSCCLREPYNNLTHKCCTSGLDQQVVEKGGGECCGGRELKEGQICCKGVKAVDKTRPGDDSCCEKVRYQMSSVYTTYNSREKDCYDGRLVTRLGPSDANCYGSRYRPEESVCCGDKVHNFPPGQTLQCCKAWDLSHTVYNNRTQMCCRGVVSNTSNTHFECCGNKTFHRYKGDNPCKRCTPSTLTDPHQLCCGGRKVLKSFGDRCCGNKPYFSSRSTCCEDKLFDVPKAGLQCCGDRLHNPAHGQCSPQYIFSHSQSSAAQTMSTAYVYLLLCLTVWKLS